MNIQIITDWAQTFKALGHEKRLQLMLGLLEKDNCDVSTMQKNLEIPQATLSQHLNVLKNAGAVDFEKNGTRACYRISDPQLIKLLIQIRKGR